MARFKIYAHYLDQKCIYVGCGNADRPYDFLRRNANWKRVVGCGQPTVVILDEKEEFKDALECEQYHIERMTNAGFVLANKPVTKYWLGKKRDPELMARLVKAAHTPEARAKRAEIMRGRKHTEEHNAKISASLKNVIRNPEWNKAISEAKKGRSNGREGIKLSAEVRQKMSDARKNSEKAKQASAKVWETRRMNGTAGGFTTDKAKAVRCKETGKVYRTAKDAALEILGSDKHIQACCVGRRMTHKKLSWEYV